MSFSLCFRCVSFVLVAFEYDKFGLSATVYEYSTRRTVHRFPLLGVD